MFGFRFFAKIRPAGAHRSVISLDSARPKLKLRTVDLRPALPTRTHCVQPSRRV